MHSASDSFFIHSFLFYVPNVCKYARFPLKILYHKTTEDRNNRGQTLLPTQQTQRGQTLLPENVWKTGIQNCGLCRLAQRPFCFNGKSFIKTGDCNGYFKNWISSAYTKWFYKAVASAKKPISSMKTWALMEIKKRLWFKVGKTRSVPIFNLTKTRYTEFPYEKRIR